MPDRVYFVYILANRPRGAIYIGVTNDLVARVAEHKTGRGSKHTQKYNIKRCVYYECHEDIHEAIAREKRLKKWLRPWKDELIEAGNPNWEDLSLRDLEY